MSHFPVRSAHRLGALTALLAAWMSAALAAPTYHVQDLGSLGPKPSSDPRSINERGQVVGTVAQGKFDVSRPVRFSGGQAIDLITETGTDASTGWATAINRRGQISGGLVGSEGQVRPFVYQGGTMELVSLPGGLSGWASGLSDRGHLLVQGEVDLGDGRCLHCSQVREPDGSWRPLQRWHGGEWAIGESINRHGWVAGWADPAKRDGPRRAIVWRHDVPHIVAGTEDSASASAHAINDAGDVVGEYLAGDQWHAFVSRAGTLTDLEPDPLGSSSAYGLNDQGAVVGRRTSQGRSGAFLAEGDALHWIEDLVEPAQQGQWRLFYAIDINNQGEIAALGRTPTGRFHALRLVPLPSR